MTKRQYDDLGWKHVGGSHPFWLVTSCHLISLDHLKFEYITCVLIRFDDLAANRSGTFQMLFSQWDLMDFADLHHFLTLRWLLFFYAAHLVSTSTTTAVITSTVINLGIIAESLNPLKNTIVAKASHFFHSQLHLLFTSLVSCCNTKIHAVLVQD